MDTVTTQQTRAHLHAMWAAVAPAWADYAEEVDRRGTAMTERLLADAQVKSGDRVLELASGPGGAGLRAAAVVGDHGDVVISDVVPEMVAIAASRASALRLRNVTTATLDLEAIDQPDHTFDAAICREGLMFAVEPALAIREIHRVLRPHGRLALSVWGSRDANPWLAIVINAVTAVTGVQVPPPGMPGPFALADHDQLADLVRQGGFDQVRVDTLDVSLRAPSFDAWWARTKAVAGPVATIIAKLDADTSTALQSRLRDDIAHVNTASTGIELPGLALIASGRAVPST